MILLMSGAAIVGRLDARKDIVNVILEINNVLNIASVRIVKMERYMNIYPRRREGALLLLHKEKWSEETELLLLFF